MTLVAEPEAPAPTPQRPARAGADLVTLFGLAIVLALGVVAYWLFKFAPTWFERGSEIRDIVANIDYPIWAIAVGLIANGLLSALRIRDALSGAYRTEFFIKTGLVLLGFSVSFTTIVNAADQAVIQALIVITVVFFGTWFIAGWLKVDDKLRALLSTAVSICGVSAAIAAAGAVRARREHLTYAATLVVIFALPSIFLLPWLVDVIGLNDAQAGAWIGGNIDTTAAVAAAGRLVNDDALAIATVVKSAQNVLIGVVAVALTLFFTLRVEKTAGVGAAAATRSAAGQLWTRFPKFVLGFLAAAALGTWYQATHSDYSALRGITNNLRDWFLILAFVSIGLEFKVKGLRKAGWRPLLVFAIATVLNLVVAFTTAYFLFRDFSA